MSPDETDLQTIDVTPAAWPPDNSWPGASAPVPPAPPRAPRRTAPVIAAVIIMMLVAGVTGYAITYSVRSSTDFETAIGVRGSGGPTTTDPDEAVLGDLNVQQSDVESGTYVTLITNGDSTTGATLDLCNATYPSESLRTARRQVAAIDSSATFVLSTEAVLYGSPNDGEQAFDELRALRTNCPDRLVPDPNGGDPSHTKFGEDPDTSWAPFPDVERIAFDVNTTDTQGDTNHTIAVYLRRGRVLLGVYFGNANPTQPRVAGETSVEGITGAFASRIAELPDSVVKG
jgi:hypothetical protein